MSENTASPAAGVPGTEQPASKRRWPVLVMGLCLVAAAVTGVGCKPKTPVAELAGDKLGLSRPMGCWKPIPWRSCPRPCWQCLSSRKP
ncbi:hypothetical protein PBOI14_68850 [Pseudomonas sp. Boi14]|nr:hypothetical protein PBOI14_68850 [Pseudomonas sp. Boi14]